MGTERIHGIIYLVDDRLDLGDQVLCSFAIVQAPAIIQRDIGRFLSKLQVSIYNVRVC